MAVIVSKKIKRLWDEWNLRGAILMSLALQMLLIFSATSRKRRAPGICSALIWLAYLLADWVAAFAVGLISNGQGDNCPDKFSVNEDLAAFWAPFLLLHLGGPDNITAFSLEDNELWIRHLLSLLIQVSAVVYVFVQSLPNDFWIPTAFLFLAGAIKYCERTRSLYLACLGNFKESLLPKPDAGPNYAQLMEEYSAKEAAQLPVEIDKVMEINNGSRTFDNSLEGTSLPEELSDFDVVKYAYMLFGKFRGLIVDHMFSFQERGESRDFFFKRTAKDAFRVLEVELNFMYDALYTKTVVVHHQIWYLVRIICSVLLAVSFQQFISHHKYLVNRFDVVVTYTLFIGAIVLDTAGHFKLIFSDWTTVLLKNSTAQSIVSAVRERLSFDRRCRWSNIISQHSLINYCLNQRSKWFEKTASFFGLKTLFDEFQYKTTIPLKEDISLKKFLFEELLAKALKAETTKAAKDIYSARGDWILQEYPCHYSHPSIAASLSEEVDYDESILLWHIATELCYCTSIGDNNPNRRLCKLLSEYMMYLLVMRPTMMSSVAGISQIRFQDTCEEAKKFFSRGQPKSKSSIFSKLKNRRQKWRGLTCLDFKTFFSFKKESSMGERVDVSTKLLKVNTVVKPIEVKGDRSKSVLFDACMLANDLIRLDNNKRWELMSKVWAELLCYAASHCRANMHAQQLSRGGELITFLWLLMAHFGLGEQFRIEAGHIRAKLIVGK